MVDPVFSSTCSDLSGGVDQKGCRAGWLGCCDPAHSFKKSTCGDDVFLLQQGLVECFFFLPHG